MITALQRAALQKVIRIDEFGLVTRKEFMDRAKAARWTVKSEERNGYQDGRYNRRKFNRMDGDEQKVYEARLKQVKTVYSIYPPAPASHLYDITRAEFDYFKSLEPSRYTDQEQDDLLYMQTNPGRGVMVKSQKAAEREYPNLFAEGLIYFDGFGPSIKLRNGIPDGYTKSEHPEQPSGYLTRAEMKAYNTPAMIQARKNKQQGLF